MGRMLLLGLLACTGCAKLNPAFGDDGLGQASASGSANDGVASEGTTATQGPSESATASSGTVDPAGTSPTAGDEEAGEGSSDESGSTEGEPELICETPLFDISIASREELGCDVPAGPAVRECVIVKAVDGVVTARLADGCTEGACVQRFDDAIDIAISGLEFEPLYGAGTCVTLDLWGERADDGTCDWQAAFFWSGDGLDLAVGNAMRDLGEVIETSLPGGGPFTWDTTIDEATECGQDTGCPVAGWRAVTFGSSTAWAYAGGGPVETALGDRELLLFNWGLSVDLSCTRHGRWAVVAPAFVEVLG